MVTRSLFVVAWAAVALAVSGCAAPRYTYAPATTTSAEVGGHPAADIPFPPESPRGDVRLAALGLTTVGAEKLRAVQLRMIVANKGDTPWIVNKTEQELSLARSDNGLHWTDFVQALVAPSSTPTVVAVGPGETATIDLFFPLPPGAGDPLEVPAFDALWVVRTGGRAIATRTPFQRWTVIRPAQNVPAAHYPYSNGVRQQGLPGTPDNTEWKAAPPPVPSLDPEYHDTQSPD